MRLRHLWYVLGAAAVGWGARGLVQHVSARQLAHAGRLLVLDVAGHDAVFAPLCVLAGLVTARVVPSALRVPLRVGLAAAAVLGALALPSITSEHRLRNSSVLPLDYERNLALLLGLVAVGVAAGAVVNVLQDRRRRAAERSRTP